MFFGRPRVFPRPAGAPIFFPPPLRKGKKKGGGGSPGGGGGPLLRKWGGSPLLFWGAGGLSPPGRAVFFFFFFFFWGVFWVFFFPTPPFLDPPPPPPGPQTERILGSPHPKTKRGDKTPFVLVHVETGWRATRPRGGPLKISFGPLGGETFFFFFSLVPRGSLFVLEFFGVPLQPGYPAHLAHRKVRREEMLQSGNAGDLLHTRVRSVGFLHAVRHRKKPSEHKLPHVPQRQGVPRRGLTRQLAPSAAGATTPTTTTTTTGSKARGFGIGHGGELVVCESGPHHQVAMKHLPH
eukprot:FR743860.1.p1 GENE.FR743860.1~~FR743860.1.p1  ORF type:complete len:293 (-),score=103.46 FR743860.1:339-1217(-)